MPAKPRFTKDDIIDAAFELAKSGDLTQVTAREVAKRLGTSPSPIFTFFDGMDDLKEAVWQKAMTTFYSSVFSSGGNMSYLDMGLKTVKFAEQNPGLFRLTFVYPHPEKSGIKADELFSDNLGYVYGVIAKAYSLSLDQAKLLHDQVWFYTFGLSMHCTAHPDALGDEQIKELLGMQFRATLGFVKSDERKN